MPRKKTKKTANQAYKTTNAVKKFTDTSNAIFDRLELQAKGLSSKQFRTWTLAHLATLIALNQKTIQKVVRQGARGAGL